MVGQTEMTDEGVRSEPNIAWKFSEPVGQLQASLTDVQFAANVASNAIDKSARSARRNVECRRYAGWVQ